MRAVVVNGVANHSAGRPFVYGMLPHVGCDASLLTLLAAQCLHFMWPSEGGLSSCRLYSTWGLAF